VDAALLSARVQHYPPGSALAQHIHETPRLCFVLRGGFEEGISGRRHARGGGQLLFRPAGARHEECFGDSGAICGLIDPTAPWLETAGQHGLRLDRPLLAEGPEVLRLCQAFERERAFGDSFSRLSLQAMLWEAIALLGRMGRGGRSEGSIWASRAVAFLEAHSSEAIGLGEVARALGVHPGHLARTFRESCGEPLGARLRRIRAERAAALIRTTRMPLIEVAADCGFAHQAHMTRVFRSTFGVTPGRYRRQVR
jgi:AraC family transcriptional regulator